MAAGYGAALGMEGGNPSFVNTAGGKPIVRACQVYDVIISELIKNIKYSVNGYTSIFIVGKHYDSIQHGNFISKALKLIFNL